MRSMIGGQRLFDAHRYRCQGGFVVHQLDARHGARDCCFVSHITFDEFDIFGDATQIGFEACAQIIEHANLSPRWTRACVMCEPMKPAPPVTSTRLINSPVECERLTKYRAVSSTIHRQHGGHAGLLQAHYIGPRGDAAFRD